MVKIIKLLSNSSTVRRMLLLLLLSPIPLLLFNALIMMFKCFVSATGREKVSQRTAWKWCDSTNRMRMGMRTRVGEVYLPKGL